ncbi:MAG: hypothetical protein HY644_09070 [Acidobacteria bacterium]|nr:hypothetical protein [Acidobacteriota bacterium]
MSWIRQGAESEKFMDCATRICICILSFAFSVAPAAPQDRESATAETEKRLASIEERLAQLEQNLTRLVEELRNTPWGVEAERLKTTAALLSEDLQTARTDEPPSTEAAGSEPTGEKQSGDRDARPTITVKDASSEITHVPYAGYMEMHLNRDGINPATLDFHRFVLLFGHGFGDRIRFWSELEFEHAFLEGAELGGELVLEQAYLDFLVHPALNFRAGMLLAPIGIINERHEPPSFNGVERPFVDTFVIPSTWFGSGAGILGDLGKGFAYRAYTMTSLDAARFSAGEGFRDGRQRGFLENARHMSFASRLEYRGIAGLALGTSFWTGQTGFNLRGIRGQARILEFDGRFRRGRFDGRAQFVSTRLDDVAQINRAVQRETGVNPNIARSMRGFYLEGAGRLLPSGFKHDLVTFYRYENFDTQHRMPAGFLPLKQFDRSAHVLGLTYYPYPDVAIKFDYDFMRSASEVFKPNNAWNFGIGWWF